MPHLYQISLSCVIGDLMCHRRLPTTDFQWCWEGEGGQKVLSRHSADSFAVGRRQKYIRGSYAQFIREVLSRASVSRYAEWIIYLSINEWVSWPIVLNEWSLCPDSIVTLCLKNNNGRFFLGRCQLIFFLRDLQGEPKVPETYISL
jgi:hypothetical protein